MGINILNTLVIQVTPEYYKVYIQETKFDSFLSPYYLLDTRGKSELAKPLKSLESNER